MARSSERQVATTSFSCEIDGEQYNVRKGDITHPDHPLIAAYPGNFEPQSKQRVKWDVARGRVEDASGGPGKRR